MSSTPIPTVLIPGQNAWNDWVAPTLTGFLIAIVAVFIVLEHMVFRPRYDKKKADCGLGGPDTSTPFLRSGPSSGSPNEGIVHTDFRPKGAMLDDP